MQDWKKGRPTLPTPVFLDLHFVLVSYTLAVLLNSSSSLLGVRNLQYIFYTIYGLNLFWFVSLKPELLIFIAVYPDYGNDSETEK